MTKGINSKVIEDCVCRYYFGSCCSFKPSHSAVIYCTNLLSECFYFFHDLVILLEHGFDCYYVDPYYPLRNDYDKELITKLFQNYNKNDIGNSRYENVYIVCIDKLIKGELEYLYQNTNIIEVIPIDYDISHVFEGFVSEDLNKIFLLDADNVDFNVIKIMENTVKRLALPESILIHYNTYLKQTNKIV